MTETVNDRIIALLKTQNLDEPGLANLIGKDRSTIYRITGKQSVPSKTTVKLIADALSVDFHLLMYGVTQHKSDAFPAEKSNVSRALELLERQLAKKDEQIATLLQMIGGNTAKLNAIGIAPFTKYFPSKLSNSVRVIN